MVLALEKTNNCHFQLFKGLLQDVAEALTEATEIHDSLSVMSNHLQKLEACEFFELKEKLPVTMETLTSSWTKSNYFKRVPSRICVLIKKSCFFLIEKEIFEASSLYCSVPEYKIVGVQQVPFKRRLEDLSTSFKECYNVFVESTYNPLDMASDAFIQDYNVFSLKLDELDHKLGTALSQACLSCITSEDSFKMMNIIQNLLKRPLINLEFKKLITSLLRNIHMELLAAKETYDNLSCALNTCDEITYKNLAPTSGILQCSIDLQNKLSFPVDSLQKIQHYLINASDVDFILKTYKEMDELLLKFQTEIFDKWQIALDIVNEQMDHSLFFTDETGNLLLNFAPQIQDIAQEIQYIKVIKKTNLLPADAIHLHDSMKKILLAHSLLACTASWYNDLTQNLMDLEKMLIKDDWEKICNNVKKGLEDKWAKSDLKEYSENIYTTTKSLFERVNQAKGNVREVQLFIETWNKSPVFVRDTPDSLVNFGMFMTPTMRQQMYHIIETSINLNRVMEAPFYKIKMILKDDIVFIPSLDQEGRYQQESFFQLFEAVIERIYSPASEINCLANNEVDYIEAITENYDLTDLKNRVTQNIESGINKILDQVDNYQHYSDLWRQDIEIALEDFVLYGPLPDIKSEENIEQFDMSLELKSPTEEEFRTQITQFDMLQKKIEDLSSEILVESWLLLDITPFKENLLTLVRNWSSAYKKKLIELKSQGKLRKVEDDGD